MKFKFSNGSKIRKQTIGFLAMLASIHIGTEIAFLTNNLYYEKRPSIIRQEFREEFGINLKGYKSTIEGKAREIRQLAEIIHNEILINGELGIKSIAPLPNNYFKCSVTQQGLKLRGEHGAYFPLIKTFAGEIENNRFSEILSHEIKHCVHEKMKNKAEFNKEWLSIVIKNGGEYLSPLERLVKRTRGLNGLGEENLENEVAKKGFITDYAQFSLEEDIAELTSKIPSSGLVNLFKDILEGGRSPNKIIIEKTKLAERYGLIPSGFLRYMELENIFCSSFEKNTSFRESSREYLEKSKLFLETYKESPYQVQIRKRRGEILEDLRYEPQRRKEERIRMAITEYQIAIKSKYCTENSFIGLLRTLENRANQLNDKRLLEEYVKIRVNYISRLNNNDITLPRTRVDYFKDREESTQTQERILD